MSRMPRLTHDEDNRCRVASGDEFAAVPGVPVREPVPQRVAVDHGIGRSGRRAVLDGGYGAL
ncbi:hypothetical protein [Embleya sp. MST-111070]|uniref:hypothetical protein n=1 Tax=Embleya sp. MST-111070 TaxID=3398231 RepID=UPI003F732818